MATQKIVISDLSGKELADDTRVRLVIRQHPQIDREVVIDADRSEIAGLQGHSEFVVVQVFSFEGPGEQLTITQATFNKLFKNGNPADVLNRAEEFAPAKSEGNGHRSPEYLASLREWGRANGWPSLSDRGRVPGKVEKAYLAAQAA